MSPEPDSMPAEKFRNHITGVIDESHRWRRTGARRFRRPLGLLGGLAAVAAMAVLAVGPAGPQTSSTSSTTSSTTSHDTTVTPSTTTPTAVTQTATPVFNCLGADPATTRRCSTPLGPTTTSRRTAPVTTTSSPTGPRPARCPSSWRTANLPGELHGQPGCLVHPGEPALPAGSIIAVSGAPVVHRSPVVAAAARSRSPTSGSVTKGTGPPDPAAVTAIGTVTGVDKTKPIICSMAHPDAEQHHHHAPGRCLRSCSNLSLHRPLIPNVAATNGTLPPEPPHHPGPAGSLARCDRSRLHRLSRPVRWPASRHVAAITRAAMAAVRGPSPPGAVTGPLRYDRPRWHARSGSRPWVVRRTRSTRTSWAACWLPTA